VIFEPEKLTKGPSHSSYPNVVVPSNVTVVPSLRSVISRVWPAGTLMPLSTIDVQLFLPETAESRSVKVQSAEALTSATPDDVVEEGVLDSMAEDEADAGALSDGTADVALYSGKALLVGVADVIASEDENVIAADDGAAKLAASLDANVAASSEDANVTAAVVASTLTAELGVTVTYLTVQALVGFAPPTPVPLGR
jgi:hypothetical protein